MIATANLATPFPPADSVPSPTLVPVNDSSLPQETRHEDPAPDGPQALKTALGDWRNLQTLAHKLTETAHGLANNADATAVLSVLQRTSVAIEAEPASTSLKAFIEGKKIPLPQSKAELLALANRLTQQTLVHPLGTFGGALSWPIPPSLEQQRDIKNLLDNNTARLEGLPLTVRRSGALDYLMNAQPLSTAQLRDPVSAMETLLGSPRAQALGNAIRTALNGYPSGDGVNDYVLAAIQLGLDPESINAPARNRVAGFDLANPGHRGKPASTIIHALGNHLEAEGRTANGSGGLAARLLLARTAPQFLVKDIPEQVVYGSQAWANLCIAVAGIEAQTPGKAANMTFAQVMSAEGAADSAPASARTAALIDWGVANNLLPVKNDAQYDQEEIDSTRSLFNAQLEKLKQVSGLLDTKLPSRKEMALALLKEKFGEGVPFEERVLRMDYRPEIRGAARFSDPYSMLDITMQGLRIEASDWVVRGSHANINLETFAAFTKSRQFNVPAAFDSQFSKAIDNFKTVKKFSVINAITHLPLEDQNNLKRGKLNFYKENSYKISFNPLAGDQLFHSSPKILVKAENNQTITTYEIDTEKGTVKRKNNSILSRPHQVLSNEITKIEEFTPVMGPWSSIHREQPASASSGNTFLSVRIDVLADATVQALGLDNPAIKKQAAGSTPAESRRDRVDSIQHFVLDLIPLKSAIGNLLDGNYKDGLVDLSLDVFGFLTAGVGAAAKVGKTLGTVGSSATKLLNTSKILGVAALGELNPLSGLGDVVVGAGKLALKGAGTLAQSVQTLKGTANGVDLAQASELYDAAASGTLKVADRTVETSAVRHNGKWYAFDADRMQPYGSPLETFDPVSTLMPPSPNTRQTGNHRHNPLNRSARPALNQPVTLKTDHLPTEEYVKHIKGAPSDAHFTPSRRQATKDRFEQEMNDYYQRMANGEMPARPTIPTTADYEKVPDLLSKSLDASDVVVLGENHRSLSSFRTLNDNMQLFKDKGVKVIGIEGMFYDKNMRLVDDGMGKTGPGYRPHDPNLTLDHLIEKFQANGIEVVPLDHPYLTRHKHERNHYTQQNIDERNLQRLQEFNYYAAQTLKQHSGNGKVIALVGRQHINTTQNIPGVAELTGGIGIGLYERAGMRVGYGTNSLDPRPGPSGALADHNDITGDLQIFAPE